MSNSITHLVKNGIPSLNGATIKLVYVYEGVEPGKCPARSSN